MIMLQCQEIKFSDKFGRVAEFTGYDGSKVWNTSHNAIDSIDCAFCRAKGIRHGTGFHDSVNTHLGKTVLYPKDLKFLHRHVSWSIQKIEGKKLRCSLCS